MSTERSTGSLPLRGEVVHQQTRQAGFSQAVARADADKLVAASEEAAGPHTSPVTERRNNSV